ncbi:MAG: hypothetical protein KF742_03765 [Cryobacterium sp.]|nr:hypothetical protein [Cryobacterium sp.]MCO5294620.1 thiamine pyrophosphate-dependent enzyme [Homoserinimonas sp.]
MKLEAELDSLLNDLWQNESNRRVFSRALKVRAFEHQMLEEFAKGSVRGTVHTCLGQELVPSLLVDLLKPSDYIFGTHRAHGYYLSRTDDYHGLAAEILGREGATSSGVGGSQHISADHLYTNGIQGGMVPIAVGSALDSKSSISVAVIGDGTLSEGVLYESMNIARLQFVPTLILIENNGIAQTTPQRQYLAGTVSGRAEAFGFGYQEADSRDVDGLRSAISMAISKVREGSPQVLNIASYRLGPHSKGDDNRPASEIKDLEERDLLNRLIKAVPEASEIWRECKKQLLEVVSEVSERKPASTTIVDYSSVELERLGSFSASRFAVTEPPYGREVVKRRLQAVLGALPDSILIGEDVETLAPGMEKRYGGAFGVTLGLSEDFPGRVRNFPISEAGLAGVGIGRALSGRPTIVEIMFGDFSTLIVDQLRQQASKLVSMYGRRLNVPVLFRLPMGGRRGYGPTHSQNLDSMFVGIPNVLVYSMNEWNLNSDVYETLLRSGLPVVALEPKDLYSKRLTSSIPVGYAINTIDDTDNFDAIHIQSKAAAPQVTLVSYGNAASIAVSALEIAARKHEIFADLFAYQVISPFDPSKIVKSVTTTRRVLIAEEAVAPQGWSSTVLSSLSDLGVMPLTVRVVGGKGDIGASSTGENAALLSTRDIVNALVKFVGE